ncbi:hypothetical protein [Pseudomonas xanthosomatis]|uniref:hypothetical protein n=1 Tax=Pseudomonas xanthosomatis TaxID=2842356 RepID=UPI001CEC81B9|nr:hypothetical protein [Pseudomonas xanthosomatis]
MIGTPCAYVQQYYQVPACIGRRVIAYGKPGVIAADRGHYIGVVLDDDAKRQVRNHHPEDGIVYGEMADRLPRAPKRSNYDRFTDEEWNCDFVEFLEINHPQFQRRMEDSLVRMVRYYRGTHYSNYPERDRLCVYRPDCDVEVAGQWLDNKADAKSSYKAALYKHLAEQRAEKKRLGY